MRRLPRETAMKCNRPILFIGLPLVMSGISVLAPDAGASSAFAITATNVTMPTTGLGFTQYSVSGIPMAGTLSVSCQYAGTNPAAKVPICNYGPVRAPAPVVAGQTVTGSIDFYPYGSAIPARLEERNHAPMVGMPLALGLLLGLGLLRRTRRGVVLTVLPGLAVLAVTAGLSGCGGNSNLNTMNPGTYQYTILADNESGGVTPLGAAASTTITVTVP